MMPKIATLAAAFLALLSVYPSARLSSQALHVPYQTFTLPNGLQVLLHEDHSVPLVAVNMWYHVGSADEKPGRIGVPRWRTRMEPPVTSWPPNRLTPSRCEFE